MKRRVFIKKGLLFLGFTQAISFCYAGTPTWSFIPLTATTISLLNNSTVTVQYQVTNQSNKAHTLVMSSIPGVSQITTGSGVCGNPFSLSAHTSCILSLDINGSQVQNGNTNGPIVCEKGSTLQCYKPSTEDLLNVTVTDAPSLVNLSASLSNLALQTSGIARTITITNSGSTRAENLLINYPTWPVGTSASSTCSSSLGAMNSCTITVTPGSNATSSCNSPYSAPTPSVITVSASNVASPVTTNVYVLTYGCIYQEGYIFAIDDTTASNASIGGTTVALTANSSGNPWDNNNNYVITGAQSLTDGAANTAQIINIQSAGSYAAQTCASYTIDSSGNSPCSTGTCYSNWYLPAICQIGAPGLGANCQTVSPAVDMHTNLPDLIGAGCSIGGSSCLAGNSWSSSEFVSAPLTQAWYDYLDNDSQVPADKSDPTLGVRCSRALTP